MKGFVAINSLFLMFHLAVGQLDCLYPTTFQAHPIKGSFAGEITGLNIETISDTEFVLVNRLLLKYKVLVFRNQSALSTEGQRKFTQRFGELMVHIEGTAHYPGYKDVNVISNLRNSSGVPIGLYGEHVENYHTDLSWHETPNKVTLLKSEILPTDGGDTYYVDTVSAYDGLPDSVKERIEPLEGHFSYLKFRDSVPGVSEEEAEYLRRGWDHPLVTIHPLTGKKNIFANKGHTASVNGVSKQESDEILQILFEQVNLPQYLYIHKWADEDAVLWDNRAVQHKATSPPQSARKLRRTTVVDREFGSAFDPVADSAFPAICEERLAPALGLSEEL